MQLALVFGHFKFVFKFHLADIASEHGFFAALVSLVATQSEHFPVTPST